MLLSVFYCWVGFLRTLSVWFFLKLPKQFIQCSQQLFEPRSVKGIAWMMGLQPGPRHEWFFPACNLDLLGGGWEYKRYENVTAGCKHSSVFFLLLLFCNKKLYCFHLVQGLGKSPEWLTRCLAAVERGFRQKPWHQGGFLLSRKSRRWGLRWQSPGPAGPWRPVSGPFPRARWLPQRPGFYPAPFGLGLSMKEGKLVTGCLTSSLMGEWAGLSNGMRIGMGPGMLGTGIMCSALFLLLTLFLFPILEK